jgi:hypothetical protein
MIAHLRVAEPPDIAEDDDFELTVPVTLPSLESIRAFAFGLHARGQEYEDSLEGWPVTYTPATPEAPLDSVLAFTPALFFIGVWPLWYVSFTWEFGDDREPSQLIGDEFLVPSPELTPA